MADTVKITKTYETSSVTGTAKTRAEMVYVDSNASEFDQASDAAAGGTIESLTVIVGYGTSSPYTFTVSDKPTLQALSDLFSGIIADLDPDSDTTDEITFS